MEPPLSRPVPLSAKAAPPGLPSARWLAGFRLFVYGAAALVVLGARAAVGPTIPTLGPLAIAGVGALFTAASAARLDRPRWLVAALVVDVLALTALLALLGGPSNPFVLLYFVQVTLAAVGCRPWGVAAVVLAASAGYGSLFFGGGGQPGAHHGAYAAHLQGMWLAFTITGGLIGAFVSRLSQAFLHERSIRERTARLLGLTTLAAGAAHELGNPLGTIKLVAADLERELRAAGRSEWAEDARVVVDEVARARGVLDRMAVGAGELAGEGLRWTTTGAVLAAAAERVGVPDRVVVQGGVDVALEVPEQALAQALAQLAQNGLQASATHQPVRLEAALDGAWVRFRVVDRGAGMSPEVLERAGEPFFTTRAPGEGMGLGLFLARTLAEQLGGDLALASQLGGGTAATLSVPRGRPPRDATLAEGRG